MSRSDDLFSKIVAQNTVIYNDYYKNGIIDGWEDPDKAYNFANLTQIEKLASSSLKGKSILDVGCGTGDFAPYLRTFDIKTYLGVDIYQPALDLAKHRYPKESFLDKDILSPTFKKKFDYVFCSGALSAKLTSLNNYYFLEKMLRKMWLLSNIGIAFNLLSDEDMDPDEQLFYYNVDEVLRLCVKIAPKATILKRKTPIPSEGRLDNMQYHFYIYRGK